MQRVPVSTSSNSPAASSYMYMAQQLRIPSSRTTRLPCRHRRAAATAAALPAGLRTESLPRHVAVVMDGNSRWARARGLPTMAGHEALKPALEEAVWLSRAWGIGALTAFAFSTENWSRPKAEVDFLMGLFERFIHDNVNQFVRYREGIRLNVIGECSRLPVSLQKTVREAREATSSNLNLDLVLAISYSGRRDIVQACTNLAEKVQDELLCPDDIDEDLFAHELQTSCPDLLIRTSGEQRLSNFLMWQSAYSELFFTNTLWPDFAEADYLEALVSFQGRDRRFGQRKTQQ